MLADESLIDPAKTTAKSYEQLRRESARSTTFGQWQARLLLYREGRVSTMRFSDQFFDYVVISDSRYSVGTPRSLVQRFSSILLLAGVLLFASAGRSAARRRPR